mmetsp:Transcript_49909/g.82816  ORF Transcript_49909/g.82816 Transcript_49909/m.82816 type:complete len:102 (-) Transcript_49909:817-1122(-)
MHLNYKNATRSLSPYLIFPQCNVSRHPAMLLPHRSQFLKTLGSPPDYASNVGFAQQCSYYAASIKTSNHSSIHRPPHTASAQLVNASNHNLQLNIDEPNDR